MPSKDYMFSTTTSKWRGYSGVPDFGTGGPTDPPTDRDGLIPMVDKPDSTNTGPYTVLDYVDVYPAAGSNSLTVPTGTYYGRRYWGTVKFGTGVIMRECVFAGPDPDTFTSILGCCQNYGTAPPQVKLYDCKMDPSLWVTMKGKASMNAYSAGWHGGNVEMYRCELVNIQDPVNWIGPNGTNTAAVTSQLTIVQQCWIHKGMYGNDMYPPNDGQPHADGFQTNYGRNLTIRGNTIGGQRNVIGYNTWPGGYNAGDDFWNSGLMLKQETSNDANHRIENVLIEGNWITGGTTSINHAYDATNPNTWASTIIRNNRIGLRGADWGKKLKADGPGLPPYDASTPNPAGYYCLRANAITSTYSGNVIDETGAPMPITNGG